jgi:hypothetical protein
MPCERTPTLYTDTHLNNYSFDGARADLTKSLSMNPAFQVTHSFALGSQTSAPSYNFGAVFANNSVSVLLAPAKHASSCRVPDIHAGRH